jgi:hypothetical protein
MIENSAFMAARDLFGLPNATLVTRVVSAKLLPQSTGMKIRVFGVGRSHSVGRPPLSVQALDKLTGFWRTYFERGGATDVGFSHHLVYAQ